MIFYLSRDSETAVVRAQDETPNDRNDRGMCTCSLVALSIRAHGYGRTLYARNKEGCGMVFVAHLPDQSNNTRPAS